MTLHLTDKEYFMNYREIKACLRGDMCKIMRIEDHRSGEISFFICADIEGGGWTTPQGRKFHVYDYDGECTMMGLGTFYLVNMFKRSVPGTLTDQYVLDFVGDLNPDLP